ncbi:hypothetical protein PLESTF_001747900 [Pleodorina starrii]|nr:hypothetical protein PLESTF_001747900 [Pleodorina starrii]
MDAVAAKLPVVDPVARLVLMRPLEAAADTPKYGAGGFLVAPGHDAAWPPADLPQEAPAHVFSWSSLRESVPNLSQRGHPSNKREMFA